MEVRPLGTGHAQQCIAVPEQPLALQKPAEGRLLQQVAII